MSTLTIGKTHFRAEQLEPFGIEIDAGVPMNMQEFIVDNVDAVRDVVQQELLLVLRGAQATPSQPWRRIIPSSAEGSTQMFHTDYDGSEYLMWILEGSKRSPIAFAPTDAVHAAARMHCDALLSQQEQVSEGTDSFEVNLRDVHARLSGNPTHTDYALPHQLFRAIVRDELLGGVIQGMHSESAFSRVASFLPWIQKQKQKHLSQIQARDRCKAALTGFHEAVLRETHSVTHIHLWRQKPDAGVLVANNPRGEGKTPLSSCMHRGVPEPGLLHQDYLLRSGLCGRGIRATEDRL